MKKSLAPIILFVYNRPQHTEQMIEALKKNPLADQSRLFIYSDGPRTEQDLSQVRAVRNIIKNIHGFNSLEIFEQQKNNGLADSIIQGVTEVSNTFGKAIILEDDLVTSPGFLTFMNEGLDTYQEDLEVASIHGYALPTANPLPDLYFLKGADCWGWSTWANRWKIFEKDGQKLLNKLKERNLTWEFDFNGSYPYTQMLKDQISGKNNSWAIRWYASCFLENLYTLHPGQALVSNIGLDDSGTHCRNTSFFHQTLDNSDASMRKIPVEESLLAKQEISQYYKRAVGKKLASALKRKIKNLFSFKL